MARLPQDDPRITDLRAYRRERERAKRREAHRSQPDGGEPLLGRRRNAGLFLVLAIVILAILSLLSGMRF